MSDIANIYGVRYRSLRKQAQTGPLNYRTSARAACAAFTKADRRMVKILRANDTIVHDFFIQWRDEYVPLVQHIQKAERSATFLKRLKEDLALDTMNGKHYAEQLTTQRLSEATQAFVTQHYDEHDKTVQRRVKALLARPTEEVDGLFSRYVSFELHQAVSDAEDMTIYDRWRAWPIRSGQRRRDRREVKRLTKRTNKTITRLLSERGEVEQSYDGIVARIFSLNIDLVSIFAARQDYTKALEKLSEKSRTSAAKRLALYEKHTKDIRSGYVDALPGDIKLSDAQSVLKEVDSVMLTVFDMDAVTRNGLMSQFKRYRELTQQIEQQQTLLEA